MKTALTATLEIAYEEFGPAEGRPVILMGGKMMSVLGGPTVRYGFLQERAAYELSFAAARRVRSPMLTWVATRAKSRDHRGSGRF